MGLYWIFCLTSNYSRLRPSVSVRLGQHKRLQGFRSESPQDRVVSSSVRLFVCLSNCMLRVLLFTTMARLYSTAATVPIMNSPSFSSHSSSLSNQLATSTSLLSLPVELRILILSHLLIAPDLLRPYPQSTLSSQVLRLCRTIYYEGICLLYKYNHFDLHEMSSLFKFANQIGPANCSLVRHLSLPTYVGSLYSLREFTGLRTLSFYYESYTHLEFLSDREGMEKEVRDMKGELEGQHGEVAGFTKQEQKERQGVRCLLLWRFIAVTTKKETKVCRLQSVELRDDHDRFP